MNRTRRLCCMACSTTRLKHPGFLLMEASEKHCVWWACPWCSNPSTVCPHGLWCYLDTARNMEAILNICFDMDGIQAMYCVPGLFAWSCYAVPSTMETMYFWTKGDILHFQSGITPWSLSLDLKLTLYFFQLPNHKYTVSCFLSYPLVDVNLYPCKHLLRILWRLWVYLIHENFV